MHAVIVLLALTATTLAAEQDFQRIVGGDDTNIEKWPFVANIQSLLYEGYWTRTCGGALITTRSVLTAAHCVHGEPAVYWRVHLGTSQLSGAGGSMHELSQLIIHEHYNRVTKDNDIAILRLATPAVQSNTVGFARIAGVNYILSDNTPVTAIGWMRRQLLSERPQQLKEIEIKIINQDVCARRHAELKSRPFYENWPVVTSAMFCAGLLDEGGKGACSGTGSGPLVHDGNIVIGVPSFSFRCGSGEFPEVHVRVASYSDWIVRNGSG